MYQSLSQFHDEIFYALGEMERRQLVETLFADEAGEWESADAALSLIDPSQRKILFPDIGDEVLRTRIQEMIDFSTQEVDIRQNPTAMLSAILSVMRQNGRNNAWLVLPDDLASFSDWLSTKLGEQSFAAKRVDLASNPSLSGDGFFLYYMTPDDTTNDPVLFELEANGGVILRLHVRDAADMAGEMWRWHAASELLKRAE